MGAFRLQIQPADTLLDFSESVPMDAMPGVNLRSEGEMLWDFRADSITIEATRRFLDITGKQPSTLHELRKKNVEIHYYGTRVFVGAVEEIEYNYDTRRTAIRVDSAGLIVSRIQVEEFSTVQNTMVAPLTNEQILEQIQTLANQALEEKEYDFRVTGYSDDASNFAANTTIVWANAGLFNLEPLLDRYQLQAIAQQDDNETPFLLFSRQEPVTVDGGIYVPNATVYYRAPFDGSIESDLEDNLERIGSDASATTSSGDDFVEAWAYLNGQWVEDLGNGQINIHDMESTGQSAGIANRYRYYPSGYPYTMDPANPIHLITSFLIQTYGASGDFRGGVSIGDRVYFDGTGSEHESVPGTPGHRTIYGVELTEDDRHNYHYASGTTLGQVMKDLAIMTDSMVGFRYDEGVIVYLEGRDSGPEITTGPLRRLRAVSRNQEEYEFEIPAAYADYVHSFNRQQIADYYEAIKNGGSVLFEGEIPIAALEFTPLLPGHKIITPAGSLGKARDIELKERTVTFKAEKRGDPDPGTLPPMR